MRGIGFSGKKFKSNYNRVLRRKDKMNLAMRVMISLALRVMRLRSITICGTSINDFLIIFIP